MKLVCPHCSKVIDVADSLAGQTAKCPFCDGPYTVPNLQQDVFENKGSSNPPPPPPPNPAPPPPKESTITQAHPVNTAKATIANSSVSAVASTTSPTTEPDWEMPDTPTKPGVWHWAIICKPEVVYWLTPITVGLLFILSFFTWEGVYFGADTLLEQSGVGMAFGSVSAAPTIKVIERTSTCPMLLIYFLLSLIGLAVCVGLALLHFGPHDLRAKMGDWPDRLLPHRPLVMMIVSAGCFFMLLFHTALPLPLETDFRGDLVANVLAEGIGLKADSPALRAKVNQLGQSQLVQRRFWWSLTWLVSLVAAGSGMIDWWGHRRGYKQWPRLELVCHHGQ